MNNATVAQRIGAVARPYVAVFDPALMAIVGSLGVIGLITLYSAGNDYPWRVTDQIRNFGIAFAVLFLAANIRPQWLMRLALPVYLIGVGLLIATEISGETVKGATRWLDIKVTRIQPSEIMKLGVPMMLAWYFHKREGALRGYDFLVAALLLAMPVALILKQPDLGTAVLVFAAGVFVIFFAGLPWKWLAVMLVSGVALLPVAWTLLHDYQRERVMTLIDPSTDPLGKGFHTLQAMIAIGSGGTFGKGLDAGHAGAPGVHSRAHQRLHFCRLLGGVWAGRQRRAGAAVLRAGVALVRNRDQRADTVCAFARRRDRSDHVHLRVRQHGHGERHPAGRRRAAAVYQLRRYRAGDAGHGVRVADGDFRAPQARSKYTRAATMRHWP